MSGNENPGSIILDPTGVVLGVKTGELPGVTSKPLAVDTGAALTPIAGSGVRISPLLNVDDFSFKYGIDSLFWRTTTTGGSTSNVLAESAADITINTGAADFTVFETYYYYRAVYGQPLDVVISIKTPQATGKTNQVLRWGVFDDNDGYFFLLDATTLSIVIRSSTSGAPVDTNSYAKAVWNIDKLDGAGPSGKTLDLTKINEYQVRFNHITNTVEFRVNAVLVHIYEPSFLITTPYARTATLPVRIEGRNSGVPAPATASVIRFYGGYVQYVGAAANTGLSFGAFNDVDVSIGTTEKPVLSIRVDPTFNTVTNRMEVVPSMLSFGSDGTRTMWRLIVNATTLTPAGTFVSTGANSGVSYNRHAGAGAAVAGGTTIFSQPLFASNDRIEPLQFALLFERARRGLIVRAGVGDILTLTAVKNTGTTSGRASLTWRELR